MKKLYNKYRHGIFEETDVAMPVIQRYGTGGGNVPIVVETKTFNQVSQSAVYCEDETAVSLTVCGGSYGGGSEVLILESNQNHATIRDDDVSPCLPASMGLGGGLRADDS